MNLQNQVFALWVAVILLAGYIMFLQQKRSYFVPPTGSVITMMDLQEYSNLAVVQKTKYKQLLTSNAAALQSSNTNFTVYTGILNNIMKSTISPGSAPGPVVPTMNPVTTPTGQFTISSSGQYLSRSGTSNSLMGSVTQRDNFIVESTGALKHVPSNLYVGANLMLVSTPVAFRFFRGSNDPVNTYRLQLPGSGTAYLSFNGSQVHLFTPA